MRRIAQATISFALTSALTFADAEAQGLPIGPIPNGGGGGGVTYIAGEGITIGSSCAGGGTSTTICLGDSGLSYASPGQIALAAGTVTANSPLLNLTETWNATGTTFNGITETITNTASASGSLLMNLSVGSNHSFTVSQSGDISVYYSGSSLRQVITNQGTLYTTALYFSGGGVDVGSGARTFLTDPAAGVVNVNGAYAVTGTKPTGTTGSCTASGFTGGATAGTFSAAACGGGTFILSGLPTAASGYACDAEDQTTPSDTVKQTANGTTSVTFQATTAASDVVAFKCLAF